MSIRGFAVLICLAASSASAQDESPQVREARMHFDLGTQHYEEADYALSLQEFQRSYEIMRQINHRNAGLVVFNIARCYSRLNRDREAMQAYQRFLDEAPPDAPQRADAESELRELRAREALGGGGISPVGPIIAAVGGAAIIAGAIVGGLALAADAEAAEGCIDGHCPVENAARADEAQLLANVADGLLFSGLGIAAVGVVLIFVLPEEESTPVSAGCTGDGCMITVRGRF